MAGGRCKQTGKEWYEWIEILWWWLHPKLDHHRRVHHWKGVPMSFECIWMSWILYQSSPSQVLFCRLSRALFNAELEPVKDFLKVISQYRPLKSLQDWPPTNGFSHHLVFDESWALAWFQFLGPGRGSCNQVLGYTLEKDTRYPCYWPSRFSGWGLGL